MKLVSEMSCQQRLGLESLMAMGTFLCVHCDGQIGGARGMRCNGRRKKIMSADLADLVTAYSSMKKCKWFESSNKLE